MMYSFSVTEQLVVFLRSFAFGILLGAGKSVLFFLPALFTKDGKIRIFVSDILFSVFLILSSFCFLLSYNLGRVRFYVLLGCFFGVMIYELALGGTVRFILSRLLCVIRRVLAFVFRPAVKITARVSEKIRKKSVKHIANKNTNVV